MKPNKRLAAATAVVMTVAGVAVLATSSPALAGTNDISTLAAEPFNSIGVNNPANGNIANVDGDGLFTIGAQSASMTVVQNGANFDLTITTGQFAQATASASPAASYEYEFDIADNGTVVLSGDQCQTSLAASPAVGIGESYPGVGGASPIPALVCSIAGSAGAHSFDIRNAVIQASSVASGTYASPRAGFDSNVNRLNVGPFTPGGTTGPSQVAFVNGVPNTAAANWLGAGNTADITFVPPASATVSAVSNQSVTNSGRAGDVISFTGSSFSAVAGTASVTIGGSAVVSTVTIDVAGNISGGGATVAGATGTNKTILITENQGSGKIATINGFTVLANRAITITPTAGGIGASVTVTGTTGTWDPTQNVTVGARSAAGVSGGNTQVTLAASGTGGFATSISVGSASTTIVEANEGAVAAASLNASQLFTFTADRCDAWIAGVVQNLSDVPTAGSPGCDVKQTIKVAVTPGNLSQRHYQVSQTAKSSLNKNATTNAAGTPANTPVANSNTGNQNVDLGSIASPTAATYIFGALNEVAVTDARGGQLGWSLTATMTNFAGTANPTGNTILAGNLNATPSCAIATPARSWDYDNTSKATIPGYVDPFASQLVPTTGAPGFFTAPAVSAGLTSAAANAALDNSVGITLCNKSTALNNFGTTSGVFNVDSGLRLKVPAFQAVDTYTAIMTVKLV